jgi:hypothetical protein
VEMGDLDATARAFRTLTLMKTIAPGSTDPGPTSANKALAYYHLARVAQRQGDARKARLLVDKSIAEQPLDEARALRETLKNA